jgi:hypothetical protein
MTRIPREWTIGQCTFRLEFPDVLCEKLQGGCSREEAVQIVNLYRELGTAQPFFILGDLGAAGKMEPEARRYISEHVRPEWLLGIIYFKTRLLHRAIVQGLLLAAEMTRSAEDPPRTKIHFVSTEDKARELLAQLRARQGGSCVC